MLCQNGIYGLTHVMHAVSQLNLTPGLEMDILTDLAQRGHEVCLLSVNNAEPALPQVFDLSASGLPNSSSTPLTSGYPSFLPELS